VTPDKIYLVGFMASGKSTIARALAARLRWRSEDVDDLIERRERLPIAEIFAQRGEPYFRSVEKEILALLQPMRHVVVATGGGTFADAENRSAINFDGVSVWIDVPLAELVPRIPIDGRRPLAADRAQLERLFVARVDAYRLAHVRVDGARTTPGAVVDRILDAIHQLPPFLAPVPDT
jgi:shikimate kinase